MIFTSACASVCVHMSTGARGGPKRAWDPPELELQVVMSNQSECRELNSVTVLTMESSLQPPETAAFVLFLSCSPWGWEILILQLEGDLTYTTRHWTNKMSGG